MIRQVRFVLEIFKKKSILICAQIIISMNMSNKSPIPNFFPQMIPFRLPSIEDSGFLEGITNLLFAAPQLREGLISKYGTVTDMNGATMAKLFGRIFCLMKDRQNNSSLYQQKIAILQKIMLLLKDMNTHFKGYRQEDILGTIGSILKRICIQHPEIKTYFDIEFVSSCEKCTSSTRDGLVSYSKQCRKGCISSIKRKMFTPPKYIIYSNSQEKCLDAIIKEEGEDFVCTYQCSAQMTYRKAEKSKEGFFLKGYYYMQREQQGKWYQIDDKNTKLLNEKNPQSNEKNGLVLLYEFVKKEALSSSVITERRLLSLVINDGLDFALYKNNKEHFNKCGICLQAYSKTNPPALLECGHLTDYRCHQSYKMCAFCNQKKPIKHKDYFKIQQIEAYQMADNTPKSYRFMVDTNSGTFQSEVLSGQVPFKRIMGYMPDFEYFKKASQNRLNIILNSASFYYEHIENVALKDINQFLRIKNKQSAFLLDSTQRRINSVKVLPRTDGGLY